MPPSWPDRVRTIAENLLTLEVNTVVSNDLSAQKMPEVPLALHSLVQVYGDYLANRGFAVTVDLLARASERVNGEDEAGTNDGARKLLAMLQSWHPKARRWTDAEVKADLPGIPDSMIDYSAPAAELTNGAETFEALQWAAWAAMQTLRASQAANGRASDADILSRIYANCRQLKEAALRLEQQNPAAAPPSLAARMGLGGAKPAQPNSRTRIRSLVRRDVADPAAKTRPRLFGATIEETARALFMHPRPVFSVDPDVTMLIRKAWDLGVERVCLQTVLQVDGDLTQIVAPLDDGQKDFLTELHKQAAKDAVTQWRSFFDVVEQLAGTVGSVVFRT
jgi:hypothetical protein